jgi:predicted PurR-regulated permease PerM
MALSLRWKHWFLLALALLTLALFFAVRSMLPPFLAAAVMIYLLNPSVERLSRLSLGKIQLGRIGAVVSVFITIFLTLGILGSFLVPRLSHEAIRIAKEVPQQIHIMERDLLPQTVVKAQAAVNSYGLPVDLNENLKAVFHSSLRFGEVKTADLALTIQKLIKKLFSTLFSIVLVFMVTLFGLLDLPRFYRALLESIPIKSREAFLAFVGELDSGLAGAIRGQLTICLINGVITTVGLLLLNIKFAVTIGIVAGVFSLIPVFGSIISTIPAVLIALTQSPLAAAQVVGLICLIHLAEANVLNPKIIGDHTELHPILILFVLMIGEHYAGAAGLLLAVPAATVLRTVIRFFWQRFLLDPVPETNQ